MPPPRPRKPATGWCQRQQWALNALRSESRSFRQSVAAPYRQKRVMAADTPERLASPLVAAAIPSRMVPGGGCDLG